MSDSISETTDEYGRSTYALETSTEALRKNTAEWEKSARAKAYQDYINSLYDDYGSVLTESAENSIKLTQAEIKLEETEKKIFSLVQKRNSGDYIPIRDIVMEAMNKIEKASQTSGAVTGIPTGFLEFRL